MSRFVAIKQDGVLGVHLPGEHGYATLCGMDGDDPGIGQTPAEVPRGAKVDCAACAAIWKRAIQYKVGDFRKRATPSTKRGTE